MFPSFTECGRLISTLELARYEKLIGTSLPDAYRAFLVLVNGGCPDPSFFRVPGHDEEEFSVHYFYGLNYDDKCYDLFYSRELDKEIFSKNLITIASTETNDLVLLDPTHPSGVIYFIDAIGTEGGKMTAIGKTFRDFINSFFQSK